MKPGDVVIAMLTGARVAKIRPAVVVSTELYHNDRPDAIVAILTSQTPTLPVALVNSLAALLDDSQEFAGSLRA